MKIKQLLLNLHYRGLVQAVVRKYYVLEGPEHYLVFSPRKHDDGAGNYTLVSKRAVGFIVKKLGGTKGISTSEVHEACSKSRFFPDHFAVLNALYALIGCKGAKISKIQGNKLYFNIWKQCQ